MSRKKRSTKREAELATKKAAQAITQRARDLKRNTLAAARLLSGSSESDHEEKSDDLNQALQEQDSGEDTTDLPQEQMVCLFKHEIVLSIFTCL